MQKCRMQNAETGGIEFLQNAKRAALSFCILHFAFCISASASELTVDTRTLSLDDRLTITLVLDGPFGDLDEVRIPLQNLTLQGDVSTLTEFSWINGATSQRKTLTYLAKPEGPGPALVGPLVLHGKGGAAETLPPIVVQVLPDAGGGSNDPLTTARELVATHRDPIFLVATTDKTEALLGEPIVVTWMLYNGTSLQRYGTDDVPKLDDFWVEDIPVRNLAPELVTVGELRMQRVPVRRAVLYPLRSGTLLIGSMGISAETIRRIGEDRFGIPYEGMLVEVNRRSPQVVIHARPLPPGPPVSAVGDVALTCEPLAPSAGGPIALYATMSGNANLRAALAPAFERPVDGSVQIVDAGFSIDRRREDAVMSRRWRYVIFPARSGRMTIPPLTATILTAAGEHRTLRCETQTIIAAASTRPPAAAGESAPAAEATARAARVWPWIAGPFVLLLLAMIALPRVRRARERRAAMRAILRSTAAETREALQVWLHSVSSSPDNTLTLQALLDESSDRGDALRSLVSYLDAAERDRLTFDPVEARRRARDVVETCAAASRMAQSRNQTTA